MKKDLIIQIHAHCILIFCQSLITIHLVQSYYTLRSYCTVFCGLYICEGLAVREVYLTCMLCVALILFHIG